MMFNEKEFERKATDYIKKIFKEKSAKLYFDQLKPQLDELIERDKHLLKTEEDYLLLDLDISKLEKGYKIDVIKLLNLIKEQYIDYKIELVEGLDKLQFKLSTT